MSYWKKIQRFGQNYRLSEFNFVLKPFIDYVNGNDQSEHGPNDITAVLNTMRKGFATKYEENCLYNKKLEEAIVKLENDNMALTRAIKLLKKDDLPLYAEFYYHFI